METRNMSDFLQQFEPYKIDNYGYVRLPEIQISKQEKVDLGLKEDASNLDFLTALARKGFKDKSGLIPKDKYKLYGDRVKNEILILDELGFVDYILLVWQIINKARELEVFIDYGRGCLMGDTYVYTGSGPKPLQDVKINDLVLTTSNTYEKVVDTFVYDCDEELVKIKTWLSTPHSPSMTKDHKVLVISDPFKHLRSQTYKRPTVMGVSEEEIRDIFQISKAEWKAANDVEIGDYLVESSGDVFKTSVPQEIDLSIYCKGSDIVEDDYILEAKGGNSHSKARNVRINRRLVMNDDFFYVLGFFLGDGWYSRGHEQIGFAFHRDDNKEELKRVRSFFDSMGFETTLHLSKKRRLSQLVVRSPILKKMFSSLVPDYCADKKIPRDFLFLNNNLTESLLFGLLESDGSECETTRNSFDSTSYSLILQAKLLAKRLGYNCSILRRPPKGNNAPGYKLRLYEPAQKKRHYKFVKNDGFTFKKVIEKTVVKNESKKVYDIHVENNHNYHTEDFIVHNSVGGSAVCWLLGISGVDPVKYGLFFERFVSRARAGKKYIDGNLYLKGDLLADIDLNLGYGINKIVEYLSLIYPHRVSRISNISTFTTKILLKDVYKSYAEANESEAREVADMIEVHFGIAKTIEEAYAEKKEFKEWADRFPDVVKIAKKLSGLMRQTSIHASGYLIGYHELTDLIPLELSKEGELTSGYDMSEVSHFFCKLDFLGLATNRIIKHTLDNIPETREEIDRKLEHDPFIYSKFQDGKLLPYGLYQISADCAYGVVNQIKPLDINGLTDAGAIARPGALDYLSGYVSNNYECPHPLFKPILEKTRNYALYQEQLMQMAVVVGFTLEESEIIRKVVGKKEVTKVKEWKEKIYTKCAENGFDKEIGDILWKILDDSSKYSFNLAHASATAHLSALTVYLKYKYPLQFYLSCLKATATLSNPIDEISAIQAEIGFFNIKLLPPSLLKSQDDYSIEGKNIRMGIGAVKGLSDKGLEKLHNFRNTGSNKFQLFEAFEAASLPISVVGPLILTGCLDESISSRSKLLLEFELYKLLKNKGEKTHIHNLGAQYNYDLFAVVKAMNEVHRDEKNKPLMKDTRRETLKKHIAPLWQKYQHNIKNEELSAWVFENAYIGFSYSTFLKKIFEKRVKGLKTVREVLTQPEKSRFVAVGVVDSVERRVSRKGKTPYLSVILKDETAQIKCFVWGEDTIDANRDLNGKDFAEGQIVIVHGSRKHEDSAYLNEGYIQDNPVIIKKSQLKKTEEEGLVTTTNNKE